jgi:hypothetical protein
MKTSEGGTTDAASPAIKTSSARAPPESNGSSFPSGLMPYGRRAPKTTAYAAKFLGTVTANKKSTEKPQNLIREG